MAILNCKNSLVKDASLHCMTKELTASKLSNFLNMILRFF